MHVSCWEKGNACAQLSRHLSLAGWPETGPPHLFPRHPSCLGGGVLAIGDGGNDVSMLELAQVGVAMANARQAALDAACFVTVGRNTDEVPGVLEAVRALVEARERRRASG